MQKVNHGHCKQKVTHVYNGESSYICQQGQIQSCMPQDCNC